MSPRILILSLPDDAHAHCIEWALRENCINTGTWYQSNFPSRDNLALRIGQNQEILTNIDLESKSPITTVWSRRFGTLHIGNGINSYDVDVAMRECARFLNAMRFTVGLGAFWINDYRSEFFANSKAVQLRLASGSGLTIPETLMTNDVAAVRTFLAQYKRVIYKTFYPAQWKSLDGSVCAYTTILRSELLDDPQSIQFCPGIFQPWIEKAYEVRIMVMGQTAIAAKVLAKKDQSDIDDWRYAQIQPDGIRIEPLELPVGIQEACVRLMAKLGIVFGCFDFIVDHEGTWHFLEVNPMGQFLWVEECCPEIRLLEAFCNFLVSGRPDFLMSKHATFSGLRASGVLENRDFIRWFEDIRDKHVKPFHPDFRPA